ncbi:type I secretion outer membrane protein [Parelusimicrobium proximum]|uniref:TolC family protein n=1 Tax=Parelusimicrobium proximum TaxID=3228953 RepID=UPI003D179D8C
MNNRMIKRIFSILTLALLLAAPSYAQTKYTLQDCIDTAISQNPSLAASESSLEAAKARIWQTASVFFPSVDVSGSLSRSRAESAQSPDDFVYGTGSSARLSASMPVFTFGKNYLSLSIQKLSYKSSDFDYQTTLNNLVYNVKKAYFDLVYAKRSIEVNESSVTQNETLYKQAKALYDVGIKPKIDVTNAEVNLNNAKLNLLTAENNEKLAYANLMNLMGIKNPDFEIDENIDFVDYQISFDALLETALGNRPDLKSLEAKVEAARKSVNQTRTDYLPNINANASYGKSGDDKLRYESGSVGLSASWNLFGGGNTVAKVNELKATLKAREYETEALKQSILKEATQAFANFSDAVSKIPVSKQGLDTAKENWELALGRYRVGLGSNIEVVDAETSYRKVGLDYAKALTDYKTALAEMFRVMGSR